MLLVMLDQFHPADDVAPRIDTNATDWFPGEGRIKVMPLHYFETEMVALYKWPAGTKSEPHQHFGGEEVYVLSGALLDGVRSLSAGTWLRNPHNSEHCPYVEEDTVIWIKTGHMLP